jgi:hypothetical protein
MKESVQWKYATSMICYSIFYTSFEIWAETTIDYTPIDSIVEKKLYTDFFFSPLASNIMKIGISKRDTECVILSHVGQK